MFSRREGFADLPVTVPCGNCVGCKVEKSRKWAVRCMHEASLHVHNSFVTLTYNNENLPRRGTLVKRDLQLFFKRLRKALDVKFRYFAVGEYGDKYGRPHYHVLFFGLDFPDKIFIRKRGDYQVYRSPRLESIWEKGLCEIGIVSFASATYCARYVLKKCRKEDEEWYYQRLDPRSGELYRVEPEFAVMSRGGRYGGNGIGHDWIKKYGDEVYLHDSLVVNGKECKPVDYYDRVLEKVDPKLHRRIKRKRELAVNPDESDVRRLEVKEKVLKSRLKTYSKGGPL